MASESFLLLLKAETSAFTREIRGAGDEIEKLGKKGKSGFAKLGAVGKAAVLGISGAAIAIGTIAVKEALEGERATARLANAIKNTGHNFKDFQGPVKDASDRLAKFGFVNDDVESAIANLTRVTKDPAKAIREMGLAADIARGRNIDLATATGILVKVQSGHVGLLGRLGIATKDAQGKTISQAEAIKRLSALYGGQAKTSAKTYAGQAAALQAQLHNLTEELGQKLLPVLVKIISVVAATVDWFSKHKEVAIALAIVVGGALVTAITAATVAWIAETAAMIAGLSPILLIIAAIAAVVAAAVFLYKNWNKIWDAVAHHPALLLVLLPLGAILIPIIAIVGAIKLLAANWDRIWPAIQKTVAIADSVISGTISGIVAAINGIKSALAGIRTAWDATVEFFKKLPERIANAASGMWHGLLDEFHAVIDAIKNAWNAFADTLTFTLPKFHIKGTSVDVGGNTVKLLPHIDTGGRIAQTGLAVVHKGETITPAKVVDRGRIGSGSTTTFSPTIVVSETDSGDRLIRKITQALNAGQGTADLRRALGI